jgi:hypothetical protein
MLTRYIAQTEAPMFVVFNKMALVIGGGSFLASILAASALGWMRNTRQESYFLVMCGALL